MTPEHHPGHDHDGSRAHPTTHQHYSARKHPEFVVLEIGGDVGALILHTDADMHGVEVEISAADDDAQRSHKEVLERTIGGRPDYSAVFDRLREGSYTLWTDGVARMRDIAIVGGQISELSWAGVLQPQ